MGGSFGGRNTVEKTRDRWNDGVWRSAVDLLQICNWKAAARKREGRRKVTWKILTYLLHGTESFLRS